MPNGVTLGGAGSSIRATESQRMLKGGDGQATGNPSAVSGYCSTAHLENVQVAEGNSTREVLLFSKGG